MLLPENRFSGLSRPQLPHRTFWRELAGLVRDGVSFIAHGGNVPAGMGGESSGATSIARLKTGLLAKGSSSKGQATRGTATPLHIAAQLGDARGLQNLLQGDKRFRPPMDAGDARRYTALHCACAGMRGWPMICFVQIVCVGFPANCCATNSCASTGTGASHNHALCTVLAAILVGGHAECAQLLIMAGCSTELTNDTGPQQIHASRSCYALRRTVIVPVSVPSLLGAG